MKPELPVIICTRGSALALAQSNFIADRLRAAFPRLQVELKIIKTTGDKLQKASLAKVNPELPKGLFTKELEEALLAGRADLAVHSLKDLPTDLPKGLMLAGTTKREDVRDVLIYRSAKTLAVSGSKIRGFAPKLTVKDLPKGAVIATSSTRRKMAILAQRADLQVVEIRGNVGTRLRKVAEQAELDATLLALAGLKRLNIKVSPNGTISGADVSPGLLASILDLKTMLPCVGQGAIGIEIRENDPRIAKLIARINHRPTFQAVTAERAFLKGMGGGCQSPVGAFAQVSGGQVSLKAVSFRGKKPKRAKAKKPVTAAAQLGELIAAKLK